MRKPFGHRVPQRSGHEPKQHRLSSECGRTPGGRLPSCELASSRNPRATDAREPVVTKFESDLAYSHNSVAVLQAVMGRPAEALESMGRVK